MTCRSIGSMEVKQLSGTRLYGNRPRAQSFGAYGANGIVPQLFQHMFPAWFVVYAFAATGIGALVPASIMGIAAANLFSRNIYQEFFRPQASATEGTTVAKIVSLLVMVAALVFIIGAPAKFVINFQPAGGAWMLQAPPASSSPCLFPGSTGAPSLQSGLSALAEARISWCRKALVARCTVSALSAFWAG